MDGLRWNSLLSFASRDMVLVVQSYLHLLADWITNDYY